MNFFLPKTIWARPVISHMRISAFWYAEYMKRAIYAAVFPAT